MVIEHGRLVTISSVAYPAVHIAVGSETACGLPLGDQVRSVHRAPAGDRCYVCLKWEKSQKAAARA